MAVHLYLPLPEKKCGPVMRDLDERIRHGCPGMPQVSIEFKVKTRLEQSRVYLFQSVIDQIVSALSTGQSLVFHYSNN